MIWFVLLPIFGVYLSGCQAIQSESEVELFLEISCINLKDDIIDDDAIVKWYLCVWCRIQ